MISLVNSAVEPGMQHRGGGEDHHGASHAARHMGKWEISESTMGISGDLRMKLR